MAIIKRGKIWYIYYYSPITGKKVWESVGPSKKLAEQMDAKRKVEILEGKFHVKRPKNITFEELLERYFAFAKPNLKPSTLKRYEVSLNQLRSHFEGKYIHRITLADIDRYRQERIEEVTPATVNRDIAFLRRVFNQARKWDLIEKSPIDGVEFYHEENIRTRYFTIEEVGRLLAECKRNPQVLTAVLIALHTGMRKGEIMSVQLHQPGVEMDRMNWVDMKNRCFHLNETKTRTPREVPINDYLYTVVEKAVGEASDNRLFRIKDVRFSFEAAMERAGIEDGIFHDLRRTFISHAMMAGYSQEIIQRVVGQEDPGIFKRYAHLSPDLRNEVVNRVGKIFTGSKPVANELFNEEAPS
jgi:integrase